MKCYVVCAGNYDDVWPLDVFLDEAKAQERYEQLEAERRAFLKVEANAGRYVGINHPSHIVREAEFHQ